MDHDADHIRQQMRETRSSLTEKLETLENQVLGTVHDARSAVHETVASVKEAVQDTVHSVKDTFNLRRQVERHPWGVMAGSVAAGFLGGRLLAERHPRRRGAGAADYTPPRLYESEDAVRTTPAEPEAHRERGWLGHMADQFAPEIRKLKAAGVGAAVGFLRDMVTPSLPPSLRDRVREVMDGVTTKLGGAPVPEPIIPTEPTAPYHDYRERRVS